MQGEGSLAPLARGAKASISSLQGAMRLVSIRSLAGLRRPHRPAHASRSLARPSARLMTAARTCGNSAFAASAAVRGIGGDMTRSSSDRPSTATAFDLHATHAQTQPFEACTTLFVGGGVHSSSPPSHRQITAAFNLTMRPSPIQTAARSDAGESAHGR
jgi:hypothetical protein